MSMIQRTGLWCVTVLSIGGLGLGMSACQSQAVSSKLSPAELGEASSTEELLPETFASLATEPKGSDGIASVDGASANVGADNVLDPEALKKEESDGNSAASGLANHLTAMGAQMFGAYWCPHCQEQKKKFGDAFSEVDYVECDPGGENPRTQLCLDNNIEAFPTWVINDEHHLGVHSLEELAELSGYGGEV